MSGLHVVTSSTPRNVAAHELVGGARADAEPRAAQVDGLRGHHELLGDERVAERDELVSAPHRERGEVPVLTRLSIIARMMSWGSSRPQAAVWSATVAIAKRSSASSPTACREKAPRPVLSP